MAVREAVAGRREDKEVMEDMEEVTPLISRDPSRDISVITGPICS